MDGELIKETFNLGRKQIAIILSALWYEQYKAIQYNIAGQSNIADHNYANSLRKLIFHRTGSLKN